MSDPRPALLVATSNRHKLAEFARLLPPGLRLVDLGDVGVSLPEETGETFAENARLKALAASTAGYLTIADDSGLEVATLAGAPGVRSARYAGEPGDDARNRTALLAALRDTPPEARQARFVCAVVLARDGQILAESEGTCFGRIAPDPRGQHGFGYDPLFLLPDSRTVAELSPAEKDRVSHRGQAVRAIMPALEAALRDEARTHERGR
ncbi:MAG: RdgB/HAM1 family non-canonical purine NTP pyrophosphatase [Thermomicrobiales bacterium]|nr:RdgB/HAM1 family non-canonical purine NTP pyrophosphatase [Thermomicrobiales bacterium]